MHKFRTYESFVALPAILTLCYSQYIDKTYEAEFAGLGLLMMGLSMIFESSLGNVRLEERFGKDKWRAPVFIVGHGFILFFMALPKFFIGGRFLVSISVGVVFLMYFFALRKAFSGLVGTRANPLSFVSHGIRLVLISLGVTITIGFLAFFLL